VLIAPFGLDQAAAQLRRGLPMLDPADGPPFFDRIHGSTLGSYSAIFTPR
jgi:hypothetical protein